MGFPFVMRQGKRNGLYILHTHGSLMPDIASSGLVVPASEQEISEARSVQIRHEQPVGVSGWSAPAGQPGENT